jgi:hypothetical protein
MTKRVIDWFAGSVMNVSMNGQIVTDLWPRTEVPRMVAIPVLDTSTLCLPLHSVLSASQPTAFYRERKLSARQDGNTQKYAGLKGITARGKYGRSTPWDLFPWRLYAMTGEPNDLITHFWVMTNLMHSFLMYLFYASTCFEQQVLIIRRAKLY